MCIHMYGKICTGRFVLTSGKICTGRFVLTSGKICTGSSKICTDCLWGAKMCIHMYVSACACAKCAVMMLKYVETHEVACDYKCIHNMLCHMSCMVCSWYVAICKNGLCRCMCVFVYIYIYIYTHMYVYIYIERERYIYIYI